MRSILNFSLLFLLFLNNLDLKAQSLQPGFDPEEYIKLMQISSRMSKDSSYFRNIPISEQYQRIYQSQEMGLKNLWDLWLKNNGKTAVISIRGTTQDPVSWLGNFYAGMVPAKGKLQISSDFEFDYDLAENPKAAVHIGWLLGTAFLSRDILPKIDSLYNTGVKDFLIIGHSQGGGIGYLLTAYFYNLQNQGSLPSDMKWKTYCSAAPKPGNLYFAYDYESMTQEGWAYNVINAADWVPQVPFSVQTIDDFNHVNPFRNAESTIKNQKFPERIVLKRIYNQLDKPTREAQRNFEKYLGNKATKLIQKTLPEFQMPEFYSSNNYVRTGNTIILQPDEEYLEKYPDNPDKIFMHHLHPPYLELAERTFPIHKKSRIMSDSTFNLKATGTEPFWGLEIGEESIRFKSMVEGFEIFNAPLAATDPNQMTDVLTYNSHTELGNIKVEIYPTDCIDSMSGESHPYRVKVSIKRGIDREFRIFEGCGKSFNKED